MTFPNRGIFLSRVLRRRTLCREHFELTLGLDHFPPAEPGQFLQVLCREPVAQRSTSAGGAMLRRPFSIAGMRRSSARVEIDILARVVGPGTAWLDGRREGDEVDVLGPLGNTFSAPRREQLALLVAGGVGLPPIRWWGENLRNDGVSCVSILGARTRDLLPVTLCAEPSQSGDPLLCVDEFARDGIQTAVTTDDGSCGLRGRVTDALALQFKTLADPGAARVYACGPEAMLKSVAAICTERGVDCEVALERVMGCGMATCQSCVVPVKDAGRAEGWRYALCCRDGPVFDAAKVSWNAPAH